MKGFICCMAALCLLLSGCARPAPEQAADGAAWEESWTTLGGVLGVEDPGHGLVLMDNNTALTASDMYLACWSVGDSIPYENEEGTEVRLYDGQLYLLLSGHSSPQEAEKEVEEWRSMAEDQYAVDDSWSDICSGQTFTMLTCTYTAETNPFDHGISAYGTWGNYAISVEFSCRDTFTGDVKEILTDFLNGFHYAA